MKKFKDQIKENTSIDEKIAELNSSKHKLHWTEPEVVSDKSDCVLIEVEEVDSPILGVIKQTFNIEIHRNGRIAADMEDVTIGELKKLKELLNKLF